MFVYLLYLAERQLLNVLIMHFLFLYSKLMLGDCIYFGIVAIHLHIHKNISSVLSVSPNF